MKVLIPIVIGLLVVGCGEKQTDTNEPTPTTTEKPAMSADSIKALRDSVVGEYVGKDEDGAAHKVVVLENGIVEWHLSKLMPFKKYNEGKWKISKEGEIHMTGKYDDIFYRINKDGSITDVVLVNIAKIRKPIPKDKQITFKKIK
jgi:hypothetical protein